MSPGNAIKYVNSNNKKIPISLVNKVTPKLT